MGILDALGVGSGGDQSQQAQQGGPPSSLGLLGRIQANYAPNVYAANQEAAKQHATYGGAMATPGMNPAVAQAMAMNPQFFQAQQGAYLPQAPQVTPVQNTDGSQTLYQQSNPGGRAGHGVSISGIPITEPPGTTSSPTEAAGGAGAAPATPGTGGGGNAPATASGPRNTLQGMPGSTAAIDSRVKSNIAAGKDPTEGIPDNYRTTVKAVLDGRMSLSEIKQTRNEHIAGTVRNILLKIDPDFNEIKNEKAASWVKSYMDTKNGDVGMSRNSLGTALNHIQASVGNQIQLKNHDANVAILGRGDNAIRNMTGDQASLAGAQNALSGTAADELARFITGKAPSDAARKEYAEKFPNASDTPRVAAGKYEAMADLLEGRLKDMEKERNENFSGKNVANDYPIFLDSHRGALQDIRHKAAELRRQGNYQIEHGQGQEAPSNAPKPTPNNTAPLPEGWKYVK